jgi:hypothetical protein
MLAHSKTQQTMLLHSQLSSKASANPGAPSPSWRSVDMNRATSQPGPSTIQLSESNLNEATMIPMPNTALGMARRNLVERFIVSAYSPTTPAGMWGSIVTPATLKFHAPLKDERYS